MKITIDSRSLFVPGDRVRFVDSPDMKALVSGTCIYGPVGHVKYDLTWLESGERKETRSCSGGERLDQLGSSLLTARLDQRTLAYIGALAERSRFWRCAWRATSLQCASCVWSDS